MERMNITIIRKKMNRDILIFIKIRKRTTKLLRKRFLNKEVLRAIRN
jgi:hypothetical protein